MACVLHSVVQAALDSRKLCPQTRLWRASRIFPSPETGSLGGREAGVRLGRAAQSPCGGASCDLGRRARTKLASHGREGQEWTGRRRRYTTLQRQSALTWPLDVAEVLYSGAPAVAAAPGSCRSSAVGLSPPAPVGNDASSRRGRGIRRRACGGRRARLV